jgi:hypothetical protein
MTRANKAGPDHFPYKDDAIADGNSNPVRALWGCDGLQCHMPSPKMSDPRVG